MPPLQNLVDCKSPSIFLFNVGSMIIETEVVSCVIFRVRLYSHRVRGLPLGKWVWDPFASSISRGIAWCEWCNWNQCIFFRQLSRSVWIDPQIYRSFWMFVRDDLNTFSWYLNNLPKLNKRKKLKSFTGIILTRGTFIPSNSWETDQHKNSIRAIFICTAISLSFGQCELTIRNTGVSRV